MNSKRILVRFWVLCAVILASEAQAQFLFVSTNNVITITGYTGSNSTVVVPRKINGLPVATIGISAFASMTNLTSVTLPDTVSTISAQAFTNCTGLTNVTLGSDVTMIGYNAFAYCPSLNGAYFRGNAPREIYPGTAFYGDPQAVVYFLPWTTGWSGTLGNAPTASYVPTVPFNYTTNNGGVTITAYTGSDSVATVPSAIYVTGISNFLPVTSIGDSAFAGGANLLTVVIPGAVTNLGSGAFAGCTNLLGAFFASNAPSADATAFSNDSHAVIYFLPGSAGWWPSFDGVPTVQWPFLYAITNGTIVIGSYVGPGGAVDIPATIGGLPVTGIANGAFAFCGALTNVTIPDSVTDLGMFAFYACSNLAAVTLSTNISNIGVSAFDSCTRLTSVNLPDGVFIIGSSAFQSCASLASVSIPANVASIGRYAFDSCASVTAITVDPLNPSYVSADGVLVSNSTCIQFPAGRAGNYTVPNGITNIGNLAFDACASLKRVVISSNVTSIGDWAFSGCSGLTNLTLPNLNLNIGSYAFESCSSLLDVTIPGTSTATPAHAFEDCISLTNATIGSGFGASAPIFNGCSSLTSVYLAGAQPRFAWNSTNAVATPTAYYLPGASLVYVSGIPKALWLPQVLGNNANFGVQSNQFGFNINWAGGMTVVVEGCADLANPIWTPLGTNTIASTLVSGSIYFSDPQWTNYPGRYYRIRGLSLGQH